MFEELANAINKTCEKHPWYTMSDRLYYSLDIYYKSLRNNGNPVEALKNYYACFSRNDNNGNLVRERFMKSMTDNNQDGALELVKLTYYVCLSIIKNGVSKRVDDQLIRYAHIYIFEYNKLVNGKDIEEVRDMVYSNPMLLKGIMNTIYPVLDSVCLLIKPKNSKTPEMKSGIVFNTITSTANRRITNVRENKIQESFGAILDQGRIQIASYVGKKNRQEDAVLSMKKEDCVLNIVADGMGGTNGGHIASMYIVKEMADWFNNLDLSLIPRDINSMRNAENNILYTFITNKLQEINDRLNRQYGDRNAPGSTIVLSFSTSAYTFILNVGDSTAYLKTGDNFKQLTKIDAAKEIDTRIVNDYELYRNVANNNVVNSYIGAGARIIRPHASIIDHSERRKILLSSDGVTDLINEENFRRMFVGDSTAIDFVDKALNPDPHVKPKDGSYEMLSGKKSDNISAIIVDIPKNSGRKM